MPECPCAVCAKRLADAAEETNQGKVLRLDLERVQNRIGELMRQISSDESPLSENWQQLRAAVRENKRLQQREGLDDGVGVFALR
jgi:predicted ArsR family transcriptional regulator